MDKRTKIVCTMGPSTDNDEVLKQLILSGMNVARFNFSHGSHEEHHERMERVKRCAQEVGRTVGILLDTKGPEIRTGVLEGGQKITLVAGEKIIVSTADCVGNKDRIHANYAQLADDVCEGSRILIDDGLIELCVEKVEGTEIHCSIVNGGELGERKGINVPGVKVGLPTITEQDRADILFGLSEGIDFIAASFLRDAKGVREIRELCCANGGEHVSIIPKIESTEGVENIDSIIAESDGIMVARGDLGVEIPAALVPHVQKEIIHKCNMAYKPVITATQMLDSMIRNPRPTRAEVTDVANAIMDGTDAIMLSGETAAGKYPVQAVQMMADIARETEKRLPDHKRLELHSDETGVDVINNAVGLAAVTTAASCGAKAILTPTQTGRSARLVSNFRPELPIFAISRNDWAVRKMTLMWGVDPYLGDATGDVNFVIQNAISEAKKYDYVEPGDITVVTAGDPSTSVTLSDKITSTNVVYVAQVR